jgi:hypothetical protein
MGVQHARRYEVAKRLKPAERDVVIRFLTELGENIAAPVDDD